MIAAADKTLKQLFVAVTDLCIHLNGYLFWVIKRELGSFGKMRSCPIIKTVSDTGLIH